MCVWGGGGGYPWHVLFKIYSSPDEGNRPAQKQVAKRGPRENLTSTTKDSKKTPLFCKKDGASPPGPLHRRPWGENVN